jgi:tetratricopeptide (TPR) repeat protein
MAPEQLQGLPADFRSDIYSVGAVLYEASTGRRPFASHHSGALVAEIISKRPPAPHEINRALSTAFENVVMRCLAKDPTRRYQHAAELRTALEALRDTRTDVATTVRSAEARNRRLIAVGALALGVAAVGGTLWRMPRKSVAAVDAAAPVELAVLPIADNGVETESDAFNNGLVETLTSRLTQLGGSHALEVVPASEMRARKISTVDEANREFGATFALRLNVERAGPMMRVNYALLDAKQHREIHGDTITAEAANPFALEDKVAESVANAMQIQLRPAEEKALTEHGTTEAGALDYYLQGRGYLQNFEKPENVESAIAEFNHAVERDPNYSAAYAGLGEAFWRKYEITNDSGWIARAKSSCDHAVSLRDNEAAGHLCLGIVYRGTGEYERAIGEYNQAAELDPADDRGVEGQALAYVAEGKSSEAEAALKRAISLRPNYWSNYNTLGSFYLKRGQYPEAETMFTQITKLVPDSYVGYGNLGAAYFDEGDYEKALPTLERSVAIRQTNENTSNLATTYFSLRRYSDAARMYEKAVAIDGSSYEIWGNLGDAYYWAPDERGKSVAAYEKAITLADEALKVNPKNAELLGYRAGYYAMLGQRNAALHDAEQSVTIAPGNPDVLGSTALVYNQFGDTERCLYYLEKAVAAGYPVATIRDTPDFDKLHDNARFCQLFDRTKLTQRR